MKEGNVVLDDLNLEEIEEEVKKEDEPKKEATKEKEKKEKIVKENYVTANQLAEELETTGFALRGWLRKQYPNRQKGTAWKWEKGSPELQEVIDSYKAYKKTPTKKETKGNDKEDKNKRF